MRSVGTAPMGFWPLAQGLWRLRAIIFDGDGVAGHGAIMVQSLFLSPGGHRYLMLLRSCPPTVFQARIS